MGRKKERSQGGKSEKEDIDSARIKTAFLSGEGENMKRDCKMTSRKCGPANYAKKKKKGRKQKRKQKRKHPENF